ncbi:MAG: SMP-30/gluconolactonase/LRE family protein [Clostridiales bacterium]|nr:SMP-30/gluconolactonase/LRE family protein [Clostridiales bacterium]
MRGELELIVDLKADLAEGPCWDAQNQLLYWVDIMENKVHIHDTKSGGNRSIDIGQNVGCIVLRKSGGAVLALQHGLYFLDLKTEKLTPVIDPESHLPGNRFNDGKCDCAGRLWVGTLMIDQGSVNAKNAGTLYCLDIDLSVRAVLRDVTISNGITWSPDNKIMYFIDTPTMQIAAFDFDPGSGEVKNKRIVATIPEGEGVPDGMTTDTEGMLWVAQWDGSNVSRWDPYTGRLVEKITLPVSGTTSCIFGGAGLEDLYITSARAGIKEEDIVKQPHAGGIFKIKPGVKGVETYKFGG